jgi:hypothetical protein
MLAWCQKVWLVGRDSVEPNLDRMTGFSEFNATQKTQLPSGESCAIVTSKIKFYEHTA